MFKSALMASDDIPSGPAALPFFRCLMAFLISTFLYKEVACRKADKIGQKPSNERRKSREKENVKQRKKRKCETLRSCSIGINRFNRNWFWLKRLRFPVEHFFNHFWLTRGSLGVVYREFNEYHLILSGLFSFFKAPT